MTCATCLFCVAGVCCNPEALRFNQIVRGQRPCQDFAELKKGIA
jgi:hypothetical protein